MCLVAEGVLGNDRVVAALTVFEARAVRCNKFCIVLKRIEFYHLILLVAHSRTVRTSKVFHNFRLIKLM